MFRTDAGRLSYRRRGDSICEVAYVSWWLSGRDELVTAVETFNVGLSTKTLAEIQQTVRRSRSVPWAPLSNFYATGWLPRQTPFADCNRPQQISRKPNIPHFNQSKKIYVSHNSQANRRRFLTLIMFVARTKQLDFQSTPPKCTKQICMFTVVGKWIADFRRFWLGTFSQATPAISVVQFTHSCQNSVMLLTAGIGTIG